MSVVAAANQPSNTGIANSSGIITQALRDLGVNPVAQNVATINLTTVSVDIIAADALRINGVNPIAVADQAAGGADTVTLAVIADRALRATGYNLIGQGTQTQTGTIGTYTAAVLAANALIELGVNQGGVGTPGGTTFAATDVATKALILLNIVASDETPDATDAAYALAWANSFHDSMAALGYATWAVSAIPDYAMDMYGIAVAAMIAPGFEKPADPQGYAGAVGALQNMAMTSAQKQTFAAAEAARVHQMLIGKNLANWAITAIPDAVAEYYTGLIVQEMATAFGKVFDPAAYNGAMAGIKRYVLSGALGQTLALQLATSIHDKLTGLGFTSWLSSAIPGYAAQAYVDMTERDLIYDVVDPSVRNMLTEKATAAEAQMRVLALSGAYGQNLAKQEVLRVQEQLNGENLVAWPWLSIPAAVSQYYTQMVAVQLAAQLGHEQNWKVWEQAKDQIRTVVLSGDYAIAIAQQEFDNIQASLVSAGIVSWDEMSIPQGVADSYSMLLALNIAPIFGKPSDGKAVAAAFEQVRKVSMLIGSQALAEQVLRGLHSEWRMREMIRWEIFDIPREAEEAYVEATAFRLGPQFPEMAPGFDPNAEMRAELMLYRAASLPSDGRTVEVSYF